MPQPVMGAYPRPTAIAEKLEAIVRLGRVNSRVKDHFDLWVLLVCDRQPADEVRSAVRATFSRRGTVIPAGIPSGLSDEYANDPRVVAQWRAFVTRSQRSAPDFSTMLGHLRDAALPIFEQARESHA